MGKFLSTGFWVHWTLKMTKNEKKVKKSLFQAPFQAIMVTSKCEKFDLNAQFGALWVPHGALGYEKLFSDVCSCFPGS